MSNEAAARPWAVHPRWPNYVVPALDVGKLIGGADDEVMDREQFATPICDTRANELSRFAHDEERVAQQFANAELIVTAVNQRDALLAEVGRLREALERITQGEHVMSPCATRFARNDDDDDPFECDCPVSIARAALSGKVGE